MLDGQPCMLSITRDITERKRTEAALSHLASIVESSDDAIVGKTLDGKIASWNLGAETVYGYTASEVVGRPLTILVPAEYQDEIPEILERIKREERIQHYETVRVRKDGHKINVSVTISPIKDASGKVVGASAIARDVTARKRTQEALQQSESNFRSLVRSEEHTSELQSQSNLVCRLLLEKKKHRDALIRGHVAPTLACSRVLRCL